MPISVNSWLFACYLMMYLILTLTPHCIISSLELSPPASSVSSRGGSLSGGYINGSRLKIKR